MKFRTIVNIDNFPFGITYSSKMFFIGSCFTDNIGSKFKNYFFDAMINPFGVLYNPVSVGKSLKYLIENKEFTEKDLIFYRGLWHSFAHHSSFSGNNKEQMLENINNSLKIASVFLKDTDILFITFGTAWVYEYKKSREVVSNCHKLPASEFNRKLLIIRDIVDFYKKLLIELNAFGKQKKVIFTVSPVRHLKDGATGNQISKSTLILAINELVGNFKNVFYFPSYEIVMDELRDYRFYASDMVHISDVAVDYIWERLSDTFFDEKTMSDLTLAKKISAALQHRVMNTDSAEYQGFIDKTKRLIAEFQKRNPMVRINF